MSIDFTKKIGQVKVRFVGTIAPTPVDNPQYRDAQIAETLLHFTSYKATTSEGQRVLRLKATSLPSICKGLGCTHMELYTSIHTGTLIMTRPDDMKTGTVPVHVTRYYKYASTVTLRGSVTVNEGDAEIFPSKASAKQVGLPLDYLISSAGSLLLPVTSVINALLNGELTLTVKGLRDDSPFELPHLAVAADPDDREDVEADEPEPVPVAVVAHCPDCRDEVRLTSEGLVARHQRAGEKHQRCIGSGRQPVPVDYVHYLNTFDEFLKNRSATPEPAPELAPELVPELAPSTTELAPELAPELVPEPTHKKASTMQDTIKLTRLSPIQVITLDEMDIAFNITKNSCELDASIAMDAVKGAHSLLPTDASSDRRVLKQIMRKIAKATGEELEVKTRRRYANTLPAHAVKVKTSKTQQAILAYLDLKHLTGLVLGKGATFTAIDLSYRDAAVIYLGELRDHRLSARSCSTLVRRLNELEQNEHVPTPAVTPDEVLADIIEPAMDVFAEPAPVPAPDQHDDFLALISAPAPEPAPEPVPAPEPAPEPEPVPVPAPVIDEAMLDDIFGSGEPMSMSSLLDLAEAEPTAEELALIEAEEEAYRNAPVEDSPEEIAAYELLEAKVHNRNPLSPVHQATTLEELREAEEQAIASSDTGLELVSLDELDEDEDEDESLARDPDEMVTLRITAQYWDGLMDRVEFLLLDMGYEVSDGCVDITRRHAKSLSPVFHKIAMHGYRDANIDFDFEDEVDEELHAWDEAGTY